MKNVSLTLDCFWIIPSSDELRIVCKTCGEGISAPFPVSVDRLSELSLQVYQYQHHQCPVSLSLWLTGQGGALVLARDQEEAAALLEEEGLNGPGLWRLVPELRLFLLFDRKPEIEGYWIPWRAGEEESPAVYQLEITAGSLQRQLPHVPSLISKGVYHA